MLTTVPQFSYSNKGKLKTLVLRNNNLDNLEGGYCSILGIHIFHLMLLQFSDKKIKATEKMNFVFGSVENILGKEKMLVSSILSCSFIIFKSHHPQGALKFGMCLNPFPNNQY